MGKASSAKKVARLTASNKGKSKQRRAKYAFPALVGGILVIGVLGIVMLRGGQPGPFPRASSTGVAGQGGGDHIHEAYGFNVCGKWQPPLPEFESQVGIHTHGDGVIHIHPFATVASGQKAQLKVFLGGAGVTLSNDHLLIPKNASGDGANVKIPGTCNGKAAVLRVAEWKHATGKDHKAVKTGPDKVYKKSFGNIWLGHDGGALTIYYGPETGKIPLPDYDKSISYLVQAEGGNDTSVTASTTTTVAGSATTTATTAAPTTTAPAGK